MVEQLGMSQRIGPRSIPVLSGTDTQPSPSTSSLNSTERRTISKSLQNAIDEEVDRILQDQYTRGTELLTRYRDVLDAIAVELIEREKIDRDELIAIVNGVDSNF